MIEFEREFFKNDPVFNNLFEVIKANHKAANHTERTLLENKHINDFCEEATHFTILRGKGDPIYISYDVTSSLKNDRVIVTVDKITVYDSMMEFNASHINGKYSKNFTQQPIKGAIKK